MTRVAEYQTGVPQGEVGAPDMEYDPVGNLDSRIRRVEQRDALREQQDAFSQINGLIRASEEAFIADHPDYHEALAHVRKHEVKKLVARGMSEQDAMNTLFAHEMQSSAAALQRGENPAAAAYQAATEYYPYEPVTDANRQLDEEAAELRNDTDNFVAILSEAHDSLRRGE